MRVVLTDGGMGQGTHRRSGKEPTPMWSARVLLDEPELVRELHADSFAPGRGVITMNTYSATPERLARDGMDDWFVPLQERGWKLAPKRARKPARTCASPPACRRCSPATGRMSRPAMTSASRSIAALSSSRPTMPT